MFTISKTKKFSSSDSFQVSFYSHAICSRQMAWKNTFKFSSRISTDTQMQINDIFFLVTNYELWITLIFILLSLFDSIKLLQNILVFLNIFAKKCSKPIKDVDKVKTKSSDWRFVASLLSHSTTLAKKLQKCFRKKGEEKSILMAKEQTGFFICEETWSSFRFSYFEQNNVWPIEIKKTRVNIDV